MIIMANQGGVLVMDTARDAPAFMKVDVTCYVHHQQASQRGVLVMDTARDAPAFMKVDVTCYVHQQANQGGVLVMDTARDAPAFMRVDVTCYQATDMQMQLIGDPRHHSGNAHPVRFARPQNVGHEGSYGLKCLCVCLRTLPCMRMPACAYLCVRQTRGLCVCHGPHGEDRMHLCSSLAFRAVSCIRTR